LGTACGGLRLRAIGGAEHPLQLLLQQLLLEQQQQLLLLLLLRLHQTHAFPLPSFSCPPPHSSTVLLLLLSVVALPPRVARPCDTGAV